MHRVAAVLDLLLPIELAHSPEDCAKTTSSNLVFQLISRIKVLSIPAAMYDRHNWLKSRQQCTLHSYPNSLDGGRFGVA